MAPRRRPGDPVFDGAGLATWPPIGCANNLSIRVREALVDTAPHAWLIIEEPPSFTNPGGYEVSAMVPLANLPVFSTQLGRAVLRDTATDWLPLSCAHKQTVRVGLRTERVTVEISGPAGHAFAAVPTEGVDVLRGRLDWLAEHHYHLSNP